MSVELVAHHSSSPSRPGRDASASSPLLAISNVMVGLYKEAFGRGPTKVRTTFAGPDTVVVVLEDGFTVAERTLLGFGEVEVLRNSRLAVQEALEERARSAVERALDRPTLAFITGIDPRRGVAVNVFTLQPAAVADAHQNGAPFRAREAR